MTEKKIKPRSECKDEKEYRAQWTPEEAHEGAKRAMEKLLKAGAKRVESNEIKVRIYPNRMYKQG